MLSILKKYKYAFLGVVVWSMLILSIFSIFINAVNFNPMSQTIDLKKYANKFIPQGWAFFTRSSREGQISLYPINDGNLSKHEFYHSNSNVLFGLDRKNSKRYAELMLFYNDIPKRDFADIEWNYQVFSKCKVNMDSIKTFLPQKRMLDSHLNGNYLMVIQEPIPWAWISNAENIQMPAKAIILNLNNIDQ